MGKELPPRGVSGLLYQPLIWLLESEPCTEHLGSGKRGLRPPDLLGQLCGILKQLRLSLFFVVLFSVVCFAGFLLCSWTAASASGIFFFSFVSTNGKRAGSEHSREKEPGRSSKRETLLWNIPALGLQQRELGTFKKKKKKWKGTDCSGNRFLSLWDPAIREDHVHLCYKTELRWGKCHGGLESTCLRGVPGMKPPPTPLPRLHWWGGGCTHKRAENHFLKLKDWDRAYSAQDCLDIPRKQELGRVTGTWAPPLCGKTPAHQPHLCCPPPPLQHRPSPLFRIAFWLLYPLTKNEREAPGLLSSGSPSFTSN